MKLQLKLIDDIFHVFIDEFDSERQLTPGEQIWLEGDEEPYFYAVAPLSERICGGLYHRDIHIAVNSNHCVRLLPPVSIYV